MPPIHPAAERLPMMGEAEIKELAKDIEDNGLVEPIIIWVDNGKPPTAPWPFSEWFLTVVDG